MRMKRKSCVTQYFSSLSPPCLGSVLFLSSSSFPHPSIPYTRGFKDDDEDDERITKKENGERNLRKEKMEKEKRIKIGGKAKNTLKELNCCSNEERHFEDQMLSVLWL